MENSTKWKPPYSIRNTSKPKGPGHWNYQTVEILGPNDVVVGTYEYNYSQKPPFYPFELNEQWYALYAKDYTASRIMSLPDCKDVWGEERAQWGFCPVEFYVPAIQETKFEGDRTGKLFGTFCDDPDEFEQPGWVIKHDWIILSPKYFNYGFVSGCVWGDDSSWKIRFFDLSEIASGKITYDDRFGYIELHDKLSLKESIVAREDSIYIVHSVEFKRDGSKVR